MLVAKTILYRGKPFNTFDSLEIKAFFKAVNSIYTPPSYKIIIDIYFLKVYKEVKLAVINTLNRYTQFNIIFNESNDYTSRRILNIFIYLPNKVSFY